jgi:hypothetical protein
MSTGVWIAVAIVTVILVIGLWLLHRAMDRHEARAREEAAKHTSDSIKGWAAAAIERERQRSDEDALRTWRDNFGSRGE